MGFAVCICTGSGKEEGVADDSPHKREFGQSISTFPYKTSATKFLYFFEGGFPHSTYLNFVQEGVGGLLPRVSW